eukprot:3591486-Prymnesium_polylepis.1
MLDAIPTTSARVVGQPRKGATVAAEMAGRGREDVALAKHHDAAFAQRGMPHPATHPAHRTQHCTRTCTHPGGAHGIRMDVLSGCAFR